LSAGLVGGRHGVLGTSVLDERARRSVAIACAQLRVLEDGSSLSVRIVAAGLVLFADELSAGGDPLLVDLDLGRFLIVHGGCLPVFVAVHPQHRAVRLRPVELLRVLSGGGSCVGDGCRDVVVARLDPGCKGGARRTELRGVGTCPRRR